MSVAEMKQDIIQKVEGLSEKQLTEVHSFINKINSPGGQEYDLTDHVNNIVSERAEVLKKLAQ